MSDFIHFSDGKLAFVNGFSVWILLSIMLILINAGKSMNDTN